MRIVGIDPGVTGAIAVFIDGHLQDVCDIPFLYEGQNDRKRVDKERLADVLYSFILPKSTVYMEQAHAMPKQGVSSMYAYGRTNGIIEGILAALGIPDPNMVHPTVWKRSLSLIGKSKPKNADLVKARKLYPHAALSLVKHHNRADAILIGHFGCIEEGFIK